MPLEAGKSKEAFGHNVEAEIKAGKPQEQAVAIAYAKAREDEMITDAMVAKADSIRAKCDTNTPALGTFDPAASPATGGYGLRADSSFSEGDKVVANTTAQGMKEGQKYTITGVHSVSRGMFGTFVEYELDHKLKISNGHMLLKKA